LELITKRLKRNVYAFTIREILEGNVDLRIPRLLCVVHKAIYHPGDVWVVKLVDSTGCMSGHISCSCFKLFGGFPEAGTVLVLENCSVFVNKIPLERHVNISDENIVSVYKK
jgi:hypothetical protein